MTGWRDVDGAPVNNFLDTGSIRITHKTGSEPTAIVSFAGVGHSSEKIQKPEFVETLRNIGVDCHAFHVIDADRYWYNKAADSIIQHLRPQLSPLSQTITLGNSMGGFGALYFASHLPHCGRALAFAPQFSVAPNFMPRFDDRWGAFTKKIPHHSLDHALKGAADTVDYVIFFGADDQHDLLHAQRFMTFQDLPITIIYVENCGHDVARFLKEKGGLPKLVNHLVTHRPDPEQIQTLLSAFGVAVGHWRSAKAESLS